MAQHSDLIRVLLVHPGCYPKPVRVVREPAWLQGLLCADAIDVVQMTASIDAWVSDEGVILNLPANQCIGAWTPHGTVVFAGLDAEGETVGLSEEQIAWILAEHFGGVS